ncbi:MAG: DciA family protein [Acidiferrobacter sp.]
MQDIAHILRRSVPTPPTDFLSDEVLRPLWLRCCSLGLRRVEPQSYCHGRLFVVVPGSAFAARLRQEMAELLTRLRTEAGLSDIREIVVRLAETHYSPPAAAQKTVPDRRYPQATHCLASLSEAVDDPALKASLARLAGTLTDVSARFASQHPQVS